MKKNTTKILMAALALFMAVGIATGSTFAWFAMQTTVTATGMEVTAKSDAIFLEIQGTEDSDFSSTGTNAVDAELYPVHHEAWTAKSNITDFDLVTASTYDNWYYRYNGNSDNATDDMTNKVYINAFTNYVAVTSYQVKLTAESAVTGGFDLYVSSITIPEDTGITVIIEGTTGYKEFSASADPIAFNNADVISDTVSTTAQTINVYIYFNGDDANVYSENISALTGEIEFTLQAFVSDHPAS